MDRVQSLWNDALPVAARGQHADRVLRWLLSQYAEPWRRYHNIAHIERMFATWQQFDADLLLIDRCSVSLAIWFHDAIYDPHRRDNEERSAEEAAQRLAALEIEVRRLACIEQMILATASHQAHTADPDIALLLDLDLEILAADAGAYDAYARAIRQEYDFVSDSDFRSRRARILRQFLERPAIYLTDLMVANFEQQARCNIQREIVELEGVEHRR